MARTHYEILGVTPDSTPEQIRSAYRKLVLKHHPDRSNDPASKPIFLAATDAYHTLTDPEKRAIYDRRSSPKPKEQVQSKPQSSPNSGTRGETNSPPSPKTEPKSQPPPTTKPNVPSVGEEVGRLVKLYQQGRLDEAETKARAVIERDSRQAVPYAVLGDISRGRGKLGEAQKMYAYAVQMEPSNPIYQRRYEELLSKSQVVSDGRRTTLAAEDRKVLAPMVGGGMVMLAALYLGLGREASFMSFVPLVGTYSLGTYVMLFISGVVVGCSLALGNLLDHFYPSTFSSTGRISPTMSLGCIALVQFWAALVLYGAVGLVRRGWNLSTSRLVMGAALATVTLSIGSYFSENVDALQVFMWGGNFVYLGAMVGWMATDSIR